MQTKKLVIASMILCGIMLLEGCAAAPTEAPVMQEDAPAAPAATMAPAPTTALEEAPAPASALQSGPTAAIISTGSGATTGNISPSDHKIVKNGDVKLLVKDTDMALDGITQIVGDTQGYIISSRVWFQDYFGKNYKYATIEIGVPVDQFEIALRRLRDLSIRVTDENETGQDVTDQYVDLQSQLTNLEATRDRIKGFLDQAKTVDEALKINQQLTDVEGQIEQIKGKMNYLSNRSAFSTITINLEPDLPHIVATPTLTPTLTPTSTPVPIEPLGPWDPGRTVQEASHTVVTAYRAIVELLIWIFVVFVPIFAPPVLILWLIIWLVRRYRKPTQK